MWGIMNVNQSCCYGAKRFYFSFPCSEEFGTCIGYRFSEFFKTWSFLNSHCDWSTYHVFALYLIVAGTMWMEEATDKNMLYEPNVGSIFINDKSRLIFTWYYFFDEINKTNRDPFCHFDALPFQKYPSKDVNMSNDLLDKCERTCLKS